MLRVRSGGLFLVAASTLAAVALLTPVFRIETPTWPQALAASLTFVVPCVLLGWAAWRFLMRERGTRSLAHTFVLHAAAALALSAVWTVLFGALVYLRHGDAISGWWRDGAMWQFIWGLIFYTALVQAARARRREREREAAAANAELQALRAQLNPHFLFNTLHSLTQLVREDPVATEQALERFGDLMRYVLSAGRDAAAEVSLEEELEFVRSYLAIERLRLGERLRVAEEIDPEALELAMPPLLLQPLVENAVRHGLAPRRDGGTIQLRAQAQGSELHVEVIDDGVGADAHAWRRADGLGLKAVERQLKARFGARASLEVATRPQGGFAVRFSLPAHLPARSIA